MYLFDDNRLVMEGDDDDGVPRTNILDESDRCLKSSELSLFWVESFSLFI